MDINEKTKVKTLRPDSKGRIAFGKLLNGVSIVRVYVQDNGRIILEPYTEMPMREAWLYENPEALSKVKNGLSNISKENLHSLGSFSQYLNEEE